MARLFVILLLIAAFAHAETLTGKVTNATVNKPAAGDDVVLLNLSQGMSEADRTKTDAKGEFKFDIKDAGMPHLVRVNHQGVNYFPEGGPIRPGMSSVEIKVYDAAKKLDGITTSIQVLRVQADANSLQMLSMYAVKNASNPPRALMNDRPYEITLPEGAQIDQAVAQSPGGMPVNSAPVPAEKNKYYFVFPLRPGETRFEVAYRLPYSGEAVIQPKIEGNLEHFAVLMPKSMQFSQKVEGTYSPMQDDKANIQVATGVTPQKDVSFRVSGTGMLPDESPGAGGEPSGAGAGGEQDAQAGRPGGGLGTPEGTPDPLHKYRWGIFAGCGALLAMGAFWVVSRNGQKSLAAAASAPSVSPEASSPVPPAHPPASAPAVSSRSSLLLEALKEELFQLEMERQQGKLSADEYVKAKAALDETLRRAVARSS